MLAYLHWSSFGDFIINGNMCGIGSLFVLRESSLHLNELL